MRERELRSDIYKETWVTVKLDDGRKVRALAYIVERRHPKYVSNLGADDIFDFVKDASGVSGSNPEYIVRTFRGLSASGLSDEVLQSLSERLLSYAQFSA